MNFTYKKNILMQSAIITITFLMSGCVKKADIEPNEIAITEAQERITTSTKIKIGKKSYTIICTDHGADALKVKSNQTGISAEVPGKSAGISNSNAEGAATIGVRTASTDAFLKMMSNNCRIYAGGGITPLGMEALQRRYQSTLATVVAIEQLTGVITAPAVNLNSNSNIGSAEQLSSISNLVIKETSEIETYTNNITKLEKEASTLKENLDATYKPEDITKIKEEMKDSDENTPSEADKVIYTQYLEKKETLDKKNKQIETQKNLLNLKKETLSSLNKMKKQINLAGQTSTSGYIQLINSGRTLSDETVKHIADKVSEMITNLNGQGYFRELCTSVLLSSVKETKSTPVIQSCLNFFNNTPQAFTENKDTNTKVSE